MDRERLNIDKILQEKFKDFKGEIPLSDWGLIEQKLQKRKRRLILWWASVLLFVGAAVSFIAYEKYSGITENSVINKPTSISGETSTTKPSVDGLIEHSDGSVEKKDNSRTQISDNHSTKNVVKYPERSHTKKIPAVDHNLPEVTSSKQLEMFPISLKGKSVKNMSPEILNEVYLSDLLALNKPQPKSEIKSRKLALELGLNIAPAIGIENLDINNSKLLNKYYFSTIDGASSAGNGFNNGLNVQITYTDKFYFRSGIYAQNYSVSRNYDYYIDSVPRVNTYNEIDDYIPIDREFYLYKGKTSIKYISIPLLLGNRTYFNSKWGLESKLGLNVSRLLSSSGMFANPTDIRLEDLNRNRNIKKWNLGASVSTGIFYKTKNNIIFTAEPNFNMMFGSAYDSKYPLSSKNYNYGININVNYILKGGKL